MWECTKSVTKWGNASTKGSARASLFGDRWSCIVGRASLVVLRCSLVVLLLSLRVSEGGLMENCYDHP
jgi:hypothetical protein